MDNSPNKRAVIVGLFVFLGLIFLLGGVLMVGNLHETFKNKIQITSLFDDVNGLQKGNNVWFSGVKVGTVSTLKLYGESQVVVNLKIDVKAKQYIRKDAKIKISTDGLIGNKILVIYGGTAAFDEVQEGDTLSVAKTFSSEDMINTLQKNNDNLLAITTDFKSISKKLTTSDGTLGKLLNDNTVYDNISTATVSFKSATSTLKNASETAQQLVGSLNEYSSKLNQKGNLANELVTDTVVFNSIKNTVLQLQNIADTADVFITKLKETGTNPNTSIGVLLHDEVAGAHLKKTIKNLESSSENLNENLEALQHNFLLRRFFKKKAKAAVKDSLEMVKNQ